MGEPGQGCELKQQDYDLTTRCYYCKQRYGDHLTNDVCPMAMSTTRFSPVVDTTWTRQAGTAKELSIPSAQGHVIRGNELSTKPTNPKDRIGISKVPMMLALNTGTVYASLAHLEGDLKYGLVNWREAGVRASIYLDALIRHYMKYTHGGQWADPKTLVPHLASIIACCNIILDAEACGKLTDDRPKPVPGLCELIDKLGDEVKHLQAIFGDQHPRHYTIADADATDETQATKPGRLLNGALNGMKL